jgi:hypothetical protein
MLCRDIAITSQTKYSHIPLQSYTFSTSGGNSKLKLLFFTQNISNTAQINGLPHKREK